MCAPREIHMREGGRESGGVNHGTIVSVALAHLVQNSGARKAHGSHSRPRQGGRALSPSMAIHWTFIFEQGSSEQKAMTQALS